MRKLNIIVCFACIIAIALTVPCKAETVETKKMRVTCYCPESCPGIGITASGKPVVGNYTIAARRDWIGSVLILYKDDNGKKGDMIGIYECTDTGGHEDLKNGTALDIYQNSLDEAWGFIHKYGTYVWVDRIKGNG